MKLLPAPGLCRRIKGHLLLMRMPNYWRFRKHLRSIWSDQ